MFLLMLQQNTMKLGLLASIETLTRLNGDG